MRYALYAIINLITGDLFNDVAIAHKHVTGATRMFTDLLVNPKADISKRPEEWALIEIGYLEDAKNTDKNIQLKLDTFEDDVLTATHQHAQQRRLVATNEIIITGKAWLAAQRTAPELEASE